MESKYRAPGAPAPVFNIPAGTRSISVFISSETGLTTGSDNPQGDEDFITINAIIDLSANTSSGYVNYAKNTNTNGSGTNVYGWQKVPLGAPIPAASKVGDATPDLNNVNFSISGSTLTITENVTTTHSSYYLEYLSPYNNSFNLLDPQVKALLHGAGTANTDLVVPIPAGANVISISGKGTNTNATDLNTSSGTEEGYSNLRFTIDLDAGLTDGFITLANGGSVDRRSTYVINNLASSSTMDFLSSAAIAGDYSGKLTSPGAVGVFNPRMYVSGTNLVIKRDANYARDFDDAYVLEFYKRTGQGMSAEFINSDIQIIPKGISSTAGVTRVFTIPPGTSAMYLNETGNACNTDRESNENSIAAYAYIDLTTETATGYFYQQVGLNGAARRDDNFAFKGVPLNNSSSRAHANTVGFKSPSIYDITFSLSADKTQLTVTNKTDLANPDYQILLSMDYYGARPDIAFNTSNITFSKGSNCNTIKANVNVCNPGSGNSSGGMPVCFYHGDPTTDPAAVLVYKGTFDQDIHEGECKTFSYDIDLSSLSSLDVDLTIIINDNGSFVPGGVGHAVGTPFTLASLANQNTGYKECYYDNNLVTKTVNVNNCPIVDLDPDNSSGATGKYNYLNYFNAGSAGAKIADADLNIIDPDGGNIHSATITLTNILNPGNEGLFINGTLPPAFMVTGNGTGAITISGSASQAAYIAAIKMIEYRNSNGAPNTANRIITTTLNDGVETGPASTTTIVMLTNPRINVTGNGTLIADASTTVNTVDGTDFGLTTTGTIAHTFTINNVGTGVINLTGTPKVSRLSGDAGFTITTQPSSSSIIAGGGTDFVVTFNPAGHPVGTYTAVIRIRNNDADPGRADYTFTVSATVNNPPVISNGSVTGIEDNTLAFAGTDFTTHFSDPDGTPLNKIKITSLPLNGSFRLNGTVITVGQEIPAAQLGNISFIPTANWNGSTSFNWQASDGTSYSGGTAQTTIIIQPANDGPQITVPTSIAVTEDVPASLKDISFADIDAGTGAVTVTFSVPNGLVSAVSGAGVTVSGTGSSLVLTGTLADINAFLGSNKVTYSSSQNPPASVVLTVNISDNGNTGGGALQDTKTVLLGITPVNDAPTGTGDTKTTLEDTPVSSTVTGNDVDGDVLTFTKATDPAHGTVVVNPGGTYTYTPAADYNGPDQFTIGISDGHGGSTTVTVNITVTAVNDAPTGTGDTKTTLEDTPVNGNVSGSDVDGDALTFTKATDPAHGTVVVNPGGTYTYTPAANYNGPDQFTIDISDGHGGTTTVTVNITVTAVNDAPTGTGDTKTTPEDTPVTGNVTGTDADGDALTFTKATDPAHGTVVVASNGDYTYTPAADYNGSDQFTIDISDGHGGTTTVTVNITVTAVNDTPTGAGDTKTTPEDTPVSGTVTGTDADGDALTFTKATDPAHGTVVVNPDGTYTYTPAADYNGTDQFTIDISDGHGGTTTVTVNITVTAVNDAPTGTGDAKTTPEDTPVSGTVTGTDADGDALTFTKATDPAHGSVVVASNGDYTYTPAADYNGPDQFTIDISDGHGGTTTVTVNITVTAVNDAPTGTGDTKTTPEDTPVSGTVTGTDADGDALTFTKATDPAHGSVVVAPNGDYTYTPAADYNGPDQFTIDISDGHGGTTTVTVNITVTAVNDAPTGTGDTKTTPEDTPVSGTVTGNDVDGDGLTFTKATDPAHGSVVVASNGDYTYTPAADYNGPDQFTIDISDGHGGTTTVTVNITVTAVNDAPTGTGDTKTTPEDTPVSGTVTGGDVDGDGLTFTKATDPAHGSVVVASNGDYTYTPAADYNGTDQFTIDISDGHGGTTTVTVNITVTAVNDAPTGTGDTKTTPEDTPVSGTVTGSDVDGDGLTFTKATDPAHGSVVVASNGDYTYTPAADYNGPDQFTIDISDGHGGTTTVTVNITVTAVNDAPTGTGDSKTTPEDTPVSGTVTGTDADGDALTFTKATDPAHGSVVVASNGDYTYTPAADYNGTDQFTIDISDGHGGTTTVTVNITVTAVNDVPAGTGDSKTTPEDTPVSGTVTGADADGDALTFTKATDPAHGSVVVASNGDYTYTPATDYNGPDQFTIDISDGHGGTTTVTVNITVTAVNDAPTGTGDTKTTPEDTPVSGTVTGADADGDALTFTKATDPAHGSVVVASNGDYTYTPAADYNGPDQFTIDISDGHGGTTTVTVNITVTAVNDAPTGTGDSKTTPEDTPVSGTVTGSDVDGDGLTFTKAADPTHGSVVVASNGDYTYTPAADYNGPDQFTIDISDGHGGTTTVTVNITVTAVNDAPTGTGDTKTTLEDTPVSGSVNGNDVDGDVLTFTKATDPAHGSVVVASNGDYTYTPAADYTGSDQFTIDISDGHGGTTTVTVNITVTAVNDAPTGTGDTQTTLEDTPVNGNVTGNDADGDALTFTKATDPAHGSVVVASNGDYTYTPAADYNGADQFTIDISDGHGGITTVTVNITVTAVNDAPTGTGDTQTTLEDTPVNGNVTGNDVDGDALTFTKATDPAHGSVVVASNGDYTYTPVADYNGPDQFTIDISDGHGVTTTVTVNITVTSVNDAPTGTGDTKTTPEDTPVSGTVTGTDADGDALTFTKASDPAHGSVVVASNGDYIYTPAADYNGSDQFTIDISDGHGGTTTVTVNITVTAVNDAPTGIGDTQTTLEDT
ncbi:beta strand repeat-containing protein, partial [Chitinophaga agrisoli]|uniref:beta strand repeat-containing protein n=1 Tax=Chitinophaga agrisoli TaxID=2607653 RepID=UPI001662199C